MSKRVPISTGKNDSWVGYPFYWLFLSVAIDVKNINNQSVSPLQ